MYIGNYYQGRNIENSIQRDGPSINPKSPLELLAEAQIQPEGITRRNFLKYAGATAAGIALTKILPGKAHAEESTLPDNLVPPLYENNYRQVINSQPFCIVMYYNSEVVYRDKEMKDKYGFTPTRFGDNFMNELINVFKKENISFFKINFKNFSRNEVYNIVNADFTGKDIQPTIMFYKYGHYITRARGPPLPENLNRYLADFIKYYQENSLKNQ